MLGIPASSNPLYALMSSNYANLYLRELIGPSFIPVTNNSPKNIDPPALENHLPNFVKFSDAAVNNRPLNNSIISKDPVIVLSVSPT